MSFHGRSSAKLIATDAAGGNWAPAAIIKRDMGVVGIEAPAGNGSQRAAIEGSTVTPDVSQVVGHAGELFVGTESTNQSPPAALMVARFSLFLLLLLIFVI